MDGGRDRGIVGPHITIASPPPPPPPPPPLPPLLPLEGGVVMPRGDVGAGIKEHVVLL